MPPDARKRRPRQRAAPRQTTGANDTPVERAKARLEPLTSGQRPIRCPHADHEDKHPSAVLYPNGFRCFSCGRKGDALDYYAITEGLSIRQALERLGALGAGGHHQPRRNPVEHVPVPEHLFETLAEDASFPTTWALAKLLAERTAEGARADIAAAGDSLAARCNLPNAIALANIIRGQATFRYLDSKTVGNPLALQRAVRRFLEVTV